MILESRQMQTIYILLWEEEKVGRRLLTMMLIIAQVILGYLVYEKQQNLRIMMKMHGLGDGAYWFISYFYFLSLSLIYLFFYVLIGSIISKMSPLLMT